MKARFALVLLAAIFIMLGTALAAEGDRVDARFEIYGFAGFHVLTNRTSVQETGERYAIATDLDTRGLASVFVDLASHSEVHGALPETPRTLTRTAPTFAETASIVTTRSITGATAR